jgi:hypothetical protein
MDSFMEIWTAIWMNSLAIWKVIWMETGWDWMGLLDGDLLGDLVNERKAARLN